MEKPQFGFFLSFAGLNLTKSFPQLRFDGSSDGVGRAEQLAALTWHRDEIQAPVSL